ncbi:hypothetical protein [Streptomyces sp. CAU 1734]|uniref:hypothetical protein n=1 Tax=Streptomyces sp. CAU 1734 TaxID=3140360 RepID=UPI0032606290
MQQASNHAPGRAADQVLAYAGHHPIAVLAIVLFGLIAILMGLVYLCVTLAARRAKPRTAAEKWRAGSVACVCAAIALYVWGALHLVLLDETAQSESCRNTGGPQQAARVDGYIGEYVPLRLVCHISEGGSYTTAVPGYVNPGVAILVLAALVTGGVAAAERAELNRKSTQKGN